jgi:hypothetical protein
MAFQLNHQKQGKCSNALADFKLETMSPSPFKIGGSCEVTKEQLWKNIMEKIKYPDGVDEGFVKCQET